MSDSVERLSLAIASLRYGGRPTALRSAVRTRGVDAIRELNAGLDDAQLDLLEREAHDLARDGVDAVLLGADGYPDSLAGTRTAPVALFVRGPAELLRRPGVGMCGARSASADGLRAARTCGTVVAANGFSVVSGYAKGVDMATHTAALTAGGTTVIVLAEGIAEFRPRPGEFARAWDPERALVVSQFAPTQPWSVGGAMTRNAVISGLSRALVVVEAGETGGTLAAGKLALDRGQPVLVLQWSDGPTGNRILSERGAVPIFDQGQLENVLHDLPSGGSLQLALM